MQRQRHVPPERFAALRDRLKLRNSDIARELGVSPTRVTELTRTKGSTARQYEAIRARLRNMKRPPRRPHGGLTAS